MLLLLMMGVLLPVSAHAEALPVQMLDSPRYLPVELDFAEWGEEAPIRLADKRGKLLLVNIWATWCPPCVVEMPHLSALQAAFPEDDFEVVTISVDGDQGAALPDFFRRMAIENLPLYHDPYGYVADAFGLTGLPTSYLVNAEGAVIGILDGPADWASEEAIALIQALRDSPE